MGLKNKIINAAAKVQRKLSDVSLNKSGTIGTEPIGKMKNGKMKMYTEVKLGRLGAIDIPQFHRDNSQLGAQLDKRPMVRAEDGSMVPASYYDKPVKKTKSPGAKY